MVKLQLATLNGSPMLIEGHHFQFSKLRAPITHDELQKYSINMDEFQAFPASDVVIHSHRARTGLPLLEVSVGNERLNCKLLLTELKSPILSELKTLAEI